MQCRFSEDGKYLYVVSFEGRTIDTTGILCGPLPTYVEVIIYTYRLCAQKPTRAPPSLIYTCDVGVVSLFEKARLSPKLPYTLHWTSSYLYVTRSAPALQVYKIPLLHRREKNDDKPEGSECLFCKETIPLPGSAADREVFFFPSDDDLSAHIVVGGQIIRTAGLKLAADIQTPIGVVLSVVEDIGGWVNRGDRKGYSDASRIGINTSLGQSDHGVNYARKCTS